MEDSYKNKYPKVGISVMIMKDDLVLLGKRKGSHGSGEYAFTGGHLEYMESFEDCAKRETLEESGIKIKNIKFQLLMNLLQFVPKHYVHIGMIAEWESGDPVNLEPDSCEGWGWYDINNLPEPMLEIDKTLVESYKTGINYFKEKE